MDKAEMDLETANFIAHSFPMFLIVMLIVVFRGWFFTKREKYDKEIAEKNEGA